MSGVPLTIQPVEKTEHRYPPNGAPVTHLFPTDAPPLTVPSPIIVFPPRVIDSRPWLVQHGGVRDDGLVWAYESHSVVQRTWNNDLVDYVCASPGCGFDSANPNAVSHHHAKKTDGNHSSVRVPRGRAKKLISSAEFVRRTRQQPRKYFRPHFELPNDELPVESEPTETSPAERPSGTADDAALLDQIRLLAAPEIKALRLQVLNLSVRLDAVERERNEARQEAAKYRRGLEAMMNGESE